MNLPHMDPHVNKPMCHNELKDIEGKKKMGTKSMNKSSAVL